MFGGKLDVGRREGLVEMCLTLTVKFYVITFKFYVFTFKFYVITSDSESKVIT